MGYITNCRVCGSTELLKVLDLGVHPPSDSFLVEKQLKEPELYYPLTVYECQNCFLVQLGYVIEPEILYQNDYPYTTGSNKAGVVHFKELAKTVLDYMRFEIKPKEYVIDIGSNDGTLLHAFRKLGCKSVFGVEPSEKIATIARKGGIPTKNEFFNRRTAESLPKAKILTATNVFAHIDDWHELMDSVNIVLKNDGVFIVEAPSLRNLVGNLEYDTIYHEHFSYLSFYTVDLIFSEHGLTLFDVEELSTHGGSLRVYLKHQNDTSKEISPNVAALHEKEAAAGMRDLSHYQDFQERANGIKHDLLSFLLTQKQQGKKVIAYGAAAKGNTLLNYCGIKNDLIEFVVDASPHKQGKFLPGSHIQVVSESLISETQPDFVVVLPWNIKEEIIKQLEYIGNWGGKFVIPIPELTVV